MLASAAARRGAVDESCVGSVGRGGLRRGVGGARERARSGRGQLGGVTAVAAEELDRRSKQAQEEQGEGKGMSDSAVRVLMTYAFSIIPEEVDGPGRQGDQGRQVRSQQIFHSQ